LTPISKPVRSPLYVGDPGTLPPPVLIPDDEVPDDALDIPTVVERAEQRYPMDSLLTSDPASLGPTVKSVFTQAAQRSFKRQLDEIDPRVRAKLEQPFGKENLSQCFYSEPALRHILLPL
jgi:hypothetical protein